MKNKKKAAVDKKKEMMIRSSAMSVRVSVPDVMSSRESCSNNLDKFAQELISRVNQLIPEPFFLETERVSSELRSPTYVQEVRIVIIMNRWREAVYFMLMKIPLIRRYVSGPKVVSYLFNSEAKIKRDSAQALRMAKQMEEEDEL